LKTLLRQLEEGQLKNNLKNEYDTQTFQKLISGLKDAKIRFYPKYGCAIVMIKDEPFKPSEIYLVFP
jgi:uncharacterized protein YutD